MLSIEHITKKYGKFTALRDISLNLPDRGLVALTGENGCGKTTLLNLISTADKPDAGTISFHGEAYRKKKYRFLRGQVVSYIQQEHLFVRYLNVEQNIGITGAEDEKIAAGLEQYGIGEKTESFPSELSGGQKQKCAFLRGILRETPVLLVDEPTSSMDERSERTTFELLKKEAQTRLVVLVTHNRGLIREYADLIVRMDKGTVAEITDNRGAGKAVIEEDRVLIPEDPRFDIAGEWQRIWGALTRKRKMTLELTEPTGGKEPLDYSGKGVVPGKNVKHSLTDTVRNGWKSLLSQSVTVILGSLISAVIIAAMAILFCLRDVDNSRFAFDFYRMNGYDDVLFEHKREDPEYRGRTYRETEEGLDALCENYGIKAIRYRHTDSVLYEIGIPADSPYLYSAATRFALIDCTDPNYYPLSCGRLPEPGEVLLTDYLADQLLLGTDYKDYADILEKGIMMVGYPVPVSGIMKTDYMVFYNATDKELNENAAVERLAEYREQYYYSAIYLNREQYVYPGMDGIKFENCNYGQFFADIEILPADSGYASGAYANETLAVSASEQKYIKGDFFATPIHSEPIRDDKTIPVLYFTDDAWRAILDEHYSCDFEYEYIGFPLVSYEEYREISEHLYFPFSPLSETISDAYGAIIAVSGPFWLVSIFSIIITVSFSFWMWSILEKGQDGLLYTYMMNGYSPGHIALFTTIRAFGKILLEACLAVPLYLLASNWINGLIAKASGYVVILFNSDLKYVWLTMLLYIGGMAVMISLKTLRRVNSRPIVLYRKAGK